MQYQISRSKGISQLMVLLLLLLSVTSCNAQSGSNPPAKKEAPLRIDSWLNISIPGICRFQAPPTMEIQGGDYKKVKEAIMEVFEISGGADLILQQKGLNDLDPKARGQYCRVLVNTTRGGEGEFLPLKEKTPVTKADLKEYDRVIRSGLEQQYTILDWYPTTVEKINGFYAFKTGYRRSLKSAMNPVVVTIYSIHNHRMMHTVTVSYRESETELWKADLDRVINTFEFERQK